SPPEFGGQPIALVPPLELIIAEIRRPMPTQPIAGMSRLADGAHECPPIFLIRPVFPITVKGEILQTARQKMFGRQSRALRMVHQHTWKPQVRPAKAEIHRRLPRAHNKVREIVTRTKPGENTVTFPTPGNDFFTCHVTAKVPAVFLGVTFNTAMQALVVPA